MEEASKTKEAFNDAGTDMVLHETPFSSPYKYDNEYYLSFQRQKKLMRSMDAADMKLQEGYRLWLTRFDTLAGASLIDKVDGVNRIVNQTTIYERDCDLFGIDDYSPAVAETVSTERIYADCEDFAMQKYYALLHLGVEKERLILLMVGTKEVDYKRINHAVLAVDTSRYYDRRHCIILDNDRWVNKLLDVKDADMKVIGSVDPDKGRHSAGLIKASMVLQNR